MSIETAICNQCNPEFGEFHCTFQVYGCTIPVNPRRACAGGLRYLSCLVCLSVSVCLSVTTLAATSFVLTLKVRYVGVYYRLFLDFNSWIFDKTFRSKVMAWKSQYANEYILAATSYGADAATFHQTGPSLVLLSLTVGYKQPGIVRQRATSLSATIAVRVSVFCFVAFRILSVTFSLTRALSQSLAHAQQRFIVYSGCTNHAHTKHSVRVQITVVV